MIMTATQKSAPVGLAGNVTLIVMAQNKEKNKSRVALEIQNTVRKPVVPHATHGNCGTANV